MSGSIASFSHAFAIPAYGDSPHLPACIESILGQSLQPVTILLGTSTPSPYLEGIAARYRLRLHLNARRADIATDWNFVMRMCASNFVTVAHQDDVYEPDYTAAMRSLLLQYPHCLLGFCDYREHTNSGPRADNLNLKVKRLLCERAFRGAAAVASRRRKRRLLNLGNPVCCPSVMLNRAALPDFEFSTELKTNLDWDAWLRLADQPGEFVYCRQKLVSKRVHPQSETSETIASRVRQNEDRQMFARMWPAPIGVLLSTIYALGYRSNEVV